MVTSSVEEGQVALLMLHLKVTLPTTSPVMLVLGDVASVIVATPDTMLHAPVPTPAEFADKLVLPTLHSA